MGLAGYLVVLIPSAVGDGFNPNYRGVNRQPRWSDELYAAGFDDPYVFGDFTDEFGLIPTLARAQDFLEKFASVLADKLEIIQVFEVHADDDQLPQRSAQSYGFDTAYGGGTVGFSAR